MKHGAMEVRTPNFEGKGKSFIKQTTSAAKETLTLRVAG